MTSVDDPTTPGRRPLPGSVIGGAAVPNCSVFLSAAAGRPARSATPIDRPIIPGERRYRDGDRVRHARWGDGIVVSSRLTRSDEEITLAFRDPQIGRKTHLASLAGLELTG
jgi:DNA helicase-2/ATP-dependent DNA helicase PcrA